MGQTLANRQYQGRLVVLGASADERARLLGRLGRSAVVITDPAAPLASIEAAQASASAAAARLAAARAARAELEQHRQVVTTASSGGRDRASGVAAATTALSAAELDLVAAQTMRDRIERGRKDAREARDTLAARAAELRSRIVGLAAHGPSAVQAALHAYDAACGADPAWDPEAAALADRLDDISQRLAELSERELPPATSNELDEAEQRLVAASARAEEAEASARSGQLSPATRSAIEAAHEAALAAEQGTHSMFGGAGARRRATAAAAHLTTVLEGAGFASYLDYLVAGHTADAGEEERRAEAAAVQQGAEIEFEALRARGEGSVAHRQLDDERKQVLRRASKILGFAPTDRIDQLLRSQPTVAPEATVRLVAALAAVGVHPRDQRVRDSAAAWIAASEEARLARGRVEPELALAEARLAAFDGIGGDEAWDLLVEIADVAVDRAGDRMREASALLESLDGADRADDMTAALVALAAALDTAIRCADDEVSDATAAARASANAAGAHAPDEDVSAPATTDEVVLGWRAQVAAGKTAVFVDAFPKVDRTIADALADLATDRSVVCIVDPDSDLRPFVGKTPTPRRVTRAAR